MPAAQQFEPMELRQESPIADLAIAYDGPPKVPAAQRDCEVEEAYSRGYEEASSQYKQQILDFRSEVNALREGAFDALEERFKSVLGEAREALLSLAYAAVARILGGLEIAPEIVESVVRALIAESGLDEERMEIRLHPADIALLEEMDTGLKARHPGLVFQPDESLRRGDCLLSSKFGKVDGLLSTKLARYKESLKPSE